jgi:hypothetical protein
MMCIHMIVWIKRKNGEKKKNILFILLFSSKGLYLEKLLVFPRKD